MYIRLIITNDNQLFYQLSFQFGFSTLEILVNPF